MVLQRDRFDVQALTARLEANPEAVPWRQRLEAASFIAEELRAGSGATMLPLIRLLAKDPKWEVRQRIAEAVQYLPKDLAEQVGAALKADDNAYVARSAAVALVRRGAVQQLLADRQDHDAVAGRFARLTTRYGKGVLQEIEAIARLKTRRRLLSMIHDLATLLSNMSISERLADKLQREGHPLAGDAARVHRARLLLEAYIDELRLTIRSIGRSRRRCGLRDLVRQANELAAEALKAQGLDAAAVSVVTEVPSQLKVSANEQALLQALVNVIKNAYESFWTGSDSLRAGRICVSAHLEGNEVVLTVADNGRGMSAQSLQSVRAFMPGAKSNTKPCSSGLGLPTAREIVLAHEGELSIDSKLGAGTMVVIRLPHGGKPQ